MSHSILRTPLLTSFQNQTFFLKKLTIRNFAMTYADFGFLAKSTPHVEKLYMTNFIARCPKDYPVRDLYCERCSQELLQQLCEWKHLTFFMLKFAYVKENYTTEACNVLTDLLADNRLAALQKLCFFDTTKSFDKLFNSFCKFASNRPKKQFHFLVTTENKKHVSKKAFLKEPRNIIFFRERRLV